MDVHYEAGTGQVSLQSGLLLGQPGDRGVAGIRPPLPPRGRQPGQRPGVTSPSPFHDVARIQPLAAQDREPLTFGGFQNQGSVTAGYRFANIKGRREEYQQLFNLRDGFRLLDFNLIGQAESKGARFADDYSLTLSGLGGDPFPGGQFSVRKAGLYDLRVSYRQSTYVWDRDDQAALPIGITGLTTNHDWSTVRKMGSINFNLRATNQLRFGFEYFRNTRDGMNFSTRTIDYFAAPAAWGSFARANPYYVAAPLSETSNRATGSVDYTRKNWNAHYRIGYQAFDSIIRGNNTASPQRSINVGEAATAGELARLISWSDSRQLKTPVSEFSYNGSPNAALDLRGGYTFFRFRGPASLDAGFNGLARASASGATTPPFVSYAISLSTRTEVTEPTHILDQGLTYKVRDWWNVLFDYRFTNSSSENRGDFHGVADAAPIAGEVDYLWDVQSHQSELNLEFIPRRDVGIRAGLRYYHRDVEVREGGVVQNIPSKVINTVSPILNVYYQPSSKISLRGDFTSTTDGTSYTRISPQTDVRSRLSARLHPWEKLWIESGLTLRNRHFDESNFQNNMRITSTNVTYRQNERLSLFAGFSYDSHFATSDVTFLRGTAPLDVLWRDQSVSRTWQAGFSANPAARLGVSFSGNYVRATGRGEISGEPPNYGPLKFPYATATVHYDVPAAGRIAVDLQRTYYIEEIVRSNNFSANLLTIRWTRDF